MTKHDYIYGRHPVSEALRGRPAEVHRVFVSETGKQSRVADLVQLAELHHVPVTAVSRRKLDELVGEVQHQGIVAAVTAFAYAELDDVLAKAGAAPLLLVLDQVQDPHNLGSLVRSALALGADAVLIPKDRSAEVTSTVVKTSAGATAHLPIVRVGNLRSALDDLKQRRFWVYGAAADGAKRVDEIDFRGPTAIVIGSEGKGLRRLVAETCDELAHIPMSGKLGSLNAAVAGAIMLYEVARQRRAP